MLDHLLDFDPPLAAPDEVTPLDKAAPQDIIDAQFNTAQWLEKVGAPTTDQAQQAAATATAQQAFSALTAQPPAQQRAALIQLKTPEAVRHLTGMLTAYDWEFVEQAKELRGYVVSQILEETKHTDAKIRLKALDMLGRVTEVALFTERVEIKKTDVTDAEIEAKIKEKLGRFMGVVDVIDVQEKENPSDEPTATH